MEPRTKNIYMGDFLNHHMTTAAQGATGLQVWVRVRIGFGLDTDRVWVLAPLLIVIQPNWSKEVSLTYWLTDLLTVSTDLTDVTLVSDDTFWRL